MEVVNISSNEEKSSNSSDSLIPNQENEVGLEKNAPLFNATDSLGSSRSVSLMQELEICGNDTFVYETEENTVFKEEPVFYETRIVDSTSSADLISVKLEDDYDISDGQKYVTMTYEVKEEQELFRDPLNERQIDASKEKEDAQAVECVMSSNTSSKGNVGLFSPNACYLEAEEYDRRLNDLLERRFICKHKGYGVFTKKEIPPNSFILEYKGKKISNEKVDDPLNVCEIDPNYSLVPHNASIDGGKRELCSFINDNQKNYNTILKPVLNDAERIGLFSVRCRTINVGEELTYSYGTGFKGMPWRCKNNLLFEFASKDDVPFVKNSSQFCTYCYDNNIAIDECKKNVQIQKNKKRNADDMKEKNSIDEDNKKTTFNKRRKKDAASNDVKKIIIGGLEQGKFSLRKIKFNGASAFIVVKNKRKFKKREKTSIDPADKYVTEKDIVQTGIGSHDTNYQNSFSVTDSEINEEATVQKEISPNETDSQKILHVTESVMSVEAMVQKPINPYDTGIRNTFSVTESVTNGEAMVQSEINSNNTDSQNILSVTESLINGETLVQIEINPNDADSLQIFPLTESVMNEECKVQKEISPNDTDSQKIFSVTESAINENNKVQNEISSNDIDSQNTFSVTDYLIEEEALVQNEISLNDADSQKKKSLTKSVTNGEALVQNEISQNDVDSKNTFSVIKLIKFESTGNKGTNVLSDDTKRRERRLLPCQYCTKKIKHYSRHLQNMHSDIDEVQEVCNFKDYRTRRKGFRRLMIKGFRKYNENKGTDQQIRLRKSKNKNKIQYKCNNCKMIFQYYSISAHKKLCYEKPPGRGLGADVTFNDNNITKDLEFLSPTYIPQVINALRNDEAKMDIKKDFELLFIGNFFYERLLMKKTLLINESAERTRKYLRILSLFKKKFNDLHFDVQKKVRYQLSDIFNISNWCNMKATINKIIYTTNENQLAVLKRGTAMILKDAIRTALMALKTLYDIYRIDENSKTVLPMLIKFHSKFITYKSTLFGPIGECNFRKKAELAAKENVSTMNDLQQIYEKVATSFSRLIQSEGIDAKTYLEIRRACILKLSFFNGKRPAEICGLNIQHWLLAKDDNYLSKMKTNSLEREGISRLINEYKVIISVVKDEKVGILIPKELWSVLDILCDKRIRKKCDVHPDNEFLFPSIYQSLNASDGSENVLRLLKSFQLGHFEITSVMVRQILDREFERFCLDEEERKAVYQFMGHYENIDKMQDSSPDDASTYPLKDASGDILNDTTSSHNQVKEKLNASTNDGNESEGCRRLPVIQSCSEDSSSEETLPPPSKKKRHSTPDKNERKVIDNDSPQSHTPVKSKGNITWTPNWKTKKSPVQAKNSPESHTPDISDEDIPWTPNWKTSGTSAPLSPYKSTSEESDLSDSSDDESKKISRPRLFNNRETALVKDHFKSYIYGNHKIPNSKKLFDFLRKNKSILSSLGDLERIEKLKNKLINTKRLDKNAKNKLNKK